MGKKVCLPRAPSPGPEHGLGLLRACWFLDFENVHFFSLYIGTKTQGFRNAPLRRITHSVVGCEQATGSPLRRVNMVEPLDRGEPLQDENRAGPSGTTKLADLAIAKVAAGAARAVPGVHSLGLGTSRALGAIRGAVGAAHEPAHGINVEVGATQVAIDMVLTASFGVPLHDLASKCPRGGFRCSARTHRVASHRGEHRDW